MSRPLIVTLTAAAALGLLWAVSPSPSPSLPPGELRQAPEFPTADPGLWINSSPLSMSDLRGLVVVLDVWTYG
jgi:hypothetical protein